MKVTVTHIKNLKNRFLHTFQQNIMNIYSY
jgi:hypothetical protein